MNRPPRRLMASAIGLLGLVALVTPVAAAQPPEMYSWTSHRDGPALDCPDFLAYGAWDISHALTLFIGADGTVTSDIENIAFEGRFYNPATGTSVADRGTKRFLDELTPDGAYLSTVMTFQRTDAYVHEAGRVVFGPSDENGDQDVRSSVGHDGFTDANIAALCTALSQ
jgi:hypothetical protein